MNTPQRPQPTARLGSMAIAMVAWCAGDRGKTLKWNSVRPPAREGPRRTVSILMAFASHEAFERTSRWEPPHAGRSFLRYCGGRARARAGKRGFHEATFHRGTGRPRNGVHD